MRSFLQNWFFDATQYRKFWDEQIVWQRRFMRQEIKRYRQMERSIKDEGWDDLTGDILHDIDESICLCEELLEHYRILRDESMRQYLLAKGIYIA